MYTYLQAQNNTTNNQRLTDSGLGSCLGSKPVLSKLLLVVDWLSYLPSNTIEPPLNNSYLHTFTYKTHIKYKVVPPTSRNNKLI